LEILDPSFEVVDTAYVHMPYVYFSVFSLGAHHTPGRPAKLHV
jgi:hypothetical protein